MSGFAFAPEELEALRAHLPAVAGRTVAAITAEVPDYTDAFRGEMGETIQQAVQVALGGFLRLAAQAGDSAPLSPARSAAYDLGRGEARSGRTADALLSAYRVGARVAWRELSAVAVDNAMSAAAVAEFAELVFAYIDELSAASVAGHADELATSGRVRRQLRERLGHALLTGVTQEALLLLAERADWTPPQELTVVLIPPTESRVARPPLDPGTLHVPGELLRASRGDVLIAPGPRRPLVRSMRGRPVVVGPTRPWTAAATSYERVLRTFDLGLRGTPLDTDEHLTDLVLSADPDALGELRSQVLQPLADLPAATVERLAETLRAWLLHQGRREEVAAELHVHPQTVRYRMTQIRGLYGPRLTDPQFVRAMFVGLAAA